MICGTDSGHLDVGISSRILYCATHRRKKKMTDREELLTWDWASQRVRIAKALCSLSEVQLVPLFAPHPVEENLLQLWIRFVSLSLLLPAAHPTCCCSDKPRPERLLFVRFYRLLCVLKSSFMSPALDQANVLSS